jgi:hypothetical protein
VTGDDGAGVFLVVLLTKFLAGRGFIVTSDKTGNRQVAGHVPRNPCTLRRLLARKKMCGHKETCDC